MPLSKLIQNVRLIAKATHQELPHREEYERLADDALAACSQWFGPPLDLKWPIVYAVSHDKTSGCGYLAGHYAIFLNPNLSTPEERCEVIVHEMYYRVTMRRPGLRWERWIDEMMAFLSEQWFLKRHGFHEHARAKRVQYDTNEDRADIDSIRRFRTSRFNITLKEASEVYPPNFYPDVRRLAIALHWVVPANDLTRLPWAKSLPAWIKSLPSDRQAPVECLLDMSSQDRPSPGRLDENACMGQALHALGRFNEALARYRSAQGHDNNQGYLSFQIALCLERSGHPDEAIAPYRKAVQHNLQDEWAPYNLALSYRKQKDHPHTIEWFEEALRRKPDWEMALGYLGEAYAEDGQWDKALTCWQRVIETGSPKWVEWAKESIKINQEGFAGMNRNDSAAGPAD